MNRVEPNRNVYIGHRYVPLLVGEWDKSIQYEGLSIVTYKGASYTSKKMTPVGIDIENEEYWVVTGNYDAQVEYYRQETKRVSDDLAQAKIDLNERIDDTVKYVDTNVENLTIYVNDEVRKNRDYVDGEIETLTGYVNDEVRKNKDYVDGEVLELTGYVDDETASTRQYVNDETSSTRQYVDDEVKRIDRQINPLSYDVDVETAKETFINKMNEKAQDLQMFDTNFVNPHGLRNDNQVTTVKDMLLMGVHALGYKDIVNAWATREKTIGIKGSNARNETLTTTLLDSSIGENYNLMGGKTGTLSGLTQNLLAVSNKKYSGEYYISCVLEGNTRYTATRQLYDIAETTRKWQRPHNHVNNNLTNGNFDEELSGWFRQTGPAELDYNEYYSHPASYIADSDGTSTQLRRPFTVNPGDKYYIMAMVKCDRYASGTLGFQFSATTPTTEASVNNVTNGWVKVSALVEPDESSANLYVGGLSSADLDGRVDKVNVINLTSRFGEGNEPNKAYLDNNDISNISAGMGMVIHVPNDNVSVTRDNIPVVFEKNPDEMGYPASLTKVITSMVMLDNFNDLETQIEITDDDLSSGSGGVVGVGDVITLKEALYLMMIVSSNTVAQAVSRVTGHKIYVDEYYRGG